ERGSSSLLGRVPLIEVIRNEMRNRFRIGFRFEAMLLLLKLLPQFTVVLDNAIMHDSNLVGDMRMCVIFRRPAMRRPARMADTDRARQRFLLQFLRKLFQLPFGTAAFDMAVRQRGDARAVIAAILEAL